jgi:hypothetical protein
MIGLWITSILSLSLVSVAPEPPTLIFLLAGQSNMVGYGNVSLLSGDVRSLPANVSIWQEDEWRPMKAEGKTFGPEISFAHALAVSLPKERIGIVKYAKGGTAIAEWSPTDPGSLYGGLMRKYRSARAAAPKSRPAAILWMQGEADAKQPDPASLYSGKLRDLVAASRDEVKEANCAFLCGQINPSSETFPHVLAVRVAQADLPKQVRWFGLVSTDGLSKNPDNLHYDTAGQWELGRRYARAYLELQKRRLKKAAGDALNQAATDPFARGLIWSGRRTFNLPEGLSPEAFRLEITERDGMKFKGDASFFRGTGMRQDLKFRGTATSDKDGLVKFTTDKKGSFQLSFEGKLNEGELVLTFGAMGNGNGPKESGTATLKGRD